jgi:hypothetical protein
MQKKEEPKESAQKRVRLIKELQTPIRKKTVLCKELEERMEKLTEKMGELEKNTVKMYFYTMQEMKNKNVSQDRIRAVEQEMKKTIFKMENERIMSNTFSIVLPERLGIGAFDILDVATDYRKREINICIIENNKTFFYKKLLDEKKYNSGLFGDTFSVELITNTDTGDELYYEIFDKCKIKSIEKNKKASALTTGIFSTIHVTIKFKKIFLGSEWFSKG